jgi:hypothetical protein
MCGKDYSDPLDEFGYSQLYGEDLASPRQSARSLSIRASRSDATTEYLAGERIGYGIAIGATLASLVVGFAAGCKLVAKWLFF